MNSREMNKCLCESFPELNSAYANEVSWQEGDETGSHVVYGDVFTPWALSAIASQEQLVIERIFAFIESLLSIGDEYSSEVVQQSVLERMADDKSIRGLVLSSMHSQTRLMFSSMIDDGDLMNSDKNRRKASMHNKIGILIVAIISAIVLLVVSPFVMFPILNDISLTNFSYQLDLLPLPENTTQVETVKTCGGLIGNGNHMDYLACLLVKSDSSYEELQAYYSSAKTGSEASLHAVEAIVLRPDGTHLPESAMLHVPIDFKKLHSVEDTSKYYIVMIFDSGYSAAFDLRGH
jgi:hypothetical protein